MHRRTVGLLAGALTAVAMAAAPAWAQEDVTTSTDAAKAKLDDSLQAKVDAGSTARVPVFVNVSGQDTAAVERLLSGERTASVHGASIVIGRIPAQAATKLASLKNVKAVGLVQFKRTGLPDNMPEPSQHARPTKAQLAERRAENKKREVPYADAPKPRRLEVRASAQAQRARRQDARLHRAPGTPASPARAAPWPCSTAAPTSAIRTC